MTIIHNLECTTVSGAVPQTHSRQCDMPVCRVSLGYLEEQVEHVSVALFHLVKQHNSERPPAISKGLVLNTTISVMQSNVSEILAN